MTPPPSRTPSVPSAAVSRRQALAGTLAVAGVSALAFEPVRVRAAEPDARRGAVRRYPMKKSINLWAFPYPDRMTLRECFQLAKDAGFDAIELNYDLDNDLSPKATLEDYRAIRRMADSMLVNTCSSEVLIRPSISSPSMTFRLSSLIAPPP